MHTLPKGLLAATGLALAAHAGAQVTFYSDEGFHGRQFHVDRPTGDLDRTDFNDRASSAVVQGGE
ncbi:MAG TPA: beta/gamma crystallin-related protein, partial [Bryobacteraceae bacterium]